MLQSYVRLSFRRKPSYRNPRFREDRKATAPPPGKAR